MRFKLPLPPPLNSIYRAAVTRSGHPFTYLTRTAKEWQTEAWLSITQQTKERPHWDIPVLLRMKMYLKTNRDYDSSLKLFSDVLETAGILKNDRYIFRAEIEKFIHDKDPRLEVELTPYVDTRPV
jgi:Holliday junction resolvase RusA-like endonuclease